MSHDHGAHERIDALMRRVEALERERMFPIVPAPRPREFVNSCAKCGLEIHGVMGYCCPNADCPAGLGPLVCTT